MIFLKRMQLSKEYIIAKFFQLGYFAQYNDGVDNYSCSCPVCLEGDTGIGNIKRCFYLPKNNNIYCHRCGWSSKPITWIKTVGGLTDEEIEREIKENDYDYESLDVKQPVVIKAAAVMDLPPDLINLTDKFQLKYYQNNVHVREVLEYLKSRRLDTAINQSGWYTTLANSPHKQRLIIPFIDNYNKIISYQSRAVDPDRKSVV